MSEDPAEAVDRLLATGDEHFSAGRPTEALASFGDAWNALPDPKEEQDAAVNVLAAIADCSFALRRWDDCRNAVQHAFHCGASTSDLFLRLRLGQSLYELGDHDEATNWLAPVYLMAGLAPFKNEDPKYLQSFRDKLRPPAGGWPEGW